jgi:transglutaminase-like putative cysteine protease
MTRRYQVTHTTRYSYEQEVTESYGRTHLTPRDDAGQRRLDHALRVSPEAELIHQWEDFYGNRTSYVEVLTPHTELVVTSASRVVIDRPPVPLEECRTGWEHAGEEALQQASGRETLWARDFRLPTGHVPLADDRDGAASAVRAFAAGVFLPGRPVGEAARELIRRIYTDFRYRPGVTSVSTSLGEVLRGREGVCQDFAHLALAALRSAGLSARYVSGYLETQPPPGKPKLLGADASHAWVSVLLPGLGWVDLDPTNDRVVDESYVVTAWGRDYADVPPLTGVIFSEGSVSTLAVAVDVVPLPD